MEEIGRRLREARLRRVMTQDQLAEAAGVQPVTISRIENGKGGGMPRQTTMQRLAAALDVPVAWLVYGEGREEKCGH